MNRAYGRSAMTTKIAVPSTHMSMRPASPNCCVSVM